MTRRGVQLNDEFRGFPGQGNCVVADSIDVKHHANDSCVILRNTNLGQEVACDLEVGVGDRWAEPRGMQVEIDSVRIRDAARGVLHRVFQIDHDLGALRG